MFLANNFYKTVSKNKSIEYWKITFILILKTLCSYVSVFHIINFITLKWKYLLILFFFIGNVEWCIKKIYLIGNNEGDFRTSEVSLSRQIWCSSWIVSPWKREQILFQTFFLMWLCGWIKTRHPVLIFFFQICLIHCISSTRNYTST